MTRQITLPNPFQIKIQNDDKNLGEIMDTLANEIENPSKDKYNFPFFYPVVFHNISKEIPQKYQFVINLYTE